jgi:hypothetical protein
VVLTGCDPVPSRSPCSAGDAGVAYAAILPYPDPVAGWSAQQRGSFDAAAAGAARWSRWSVRAQGTWRVVAPRCSDATDGSDP